MRISHLLKRDERVVRLNAVGLDRVSPGASVPVYTEGKRRCFPGVWPLVYTKTQFLITENDSFFKVWRFWKTLEILENSGDFGKLQFGGFL